MSENTSLSESPEVFLFSKVNWPFRNKKVANEVWDSIPEDKKALPYGHRVVASGTASKTAVKSVVFRIIAFPSKSIDGRQSLRYYAQVVTASKNGDDIEYSISGEHGAERSFSKFTEVMNEVKDLYE